MSVGGFYPGQTYPGGSGDEPVGIVGGAALGLAGGADFTIDFVAVPLVGREIGGGRYVRAKDERKRPLRRTKKRSGGAVLALCGGATVTIEYIDVLTEEELLLLLV